MTVAAIILIVLAGALRTRVGRLWLAIELIAAGNAAIAAASRIIDRLEGEAK